MAGAWLDGDSVTGNGYYKIGLRYYDDHTNRWTQTDPLERVINPTQPAEAQPYNYAGCNPTNQTDPTGALFSDEFNCAVAIAGLIGAEVALVVAVFATGGLGIFLAGFGYTIAGLSILGSCYDDEGNPVF